jgi:hypothetical protein
MPQGGARGHLRSLVLGAFWRHIASSVKTQQERARAGVFGSERRATAAGVYQLALERVGVHTTHLGDEHEALEVGIQIWIGFFEGADNYC